MRIYGCHRRQEPNLISNHPTWKLGEKVSLDLCASEETFVSVEHDLETLIVKVAVFIFNPMAKEKKNNGNENNRRWYFF
jgi:hypothetical protein